MAEPLFSVILPTHNRPHLLPQAIESVLAQTVDDFQLVIVDDGSDPPATVPTDSRIQHARLDQPRGPARARNRGLELAVGRYVCFLDDDDLFTPPRLEIAERGLRTSPLTVCYATFLGRPVRDNRRLDGHVGDTILEGPTPSLGRTAVRRDLAPRFDERWAAVEDLDWWRRAAERLPVSTIPEVGYLVRLHSGPRGANRLETRIRENVEYIAEHADYFATHPRSEAYRRMRVGLMEEGRNDLAAARRALARSVRLHPRSRSVWHLARTCMPGPANRGLGRLRKTLGQ